jgi:hypothetical protein
MQKAVSFQAYIYERGLHARQYARHLAHVHVSDNSPEIGALNVHLLENTVFDHGYPCFLGRYIDQDFFTQSQFFPIPASSRFSSNIGKPTTPE